MTKEQRDYWQKQAQQIDTAGSDEAEDLKRLILNICDECNTDGI